MIRTGQDVAQAAGFEVFAEVPADQGGATIGHQAWMIFRRHVIHACRFTGQFDHLAERLGIHARLQLPGQERRLKSSSTLMR